MKTCGNYVKKMRKQYGLTQEHLAVKLGVGLRYLRVLETDKPSLRMGKVNMVLKCSALNWGWCPKTRRLKDETG